MRRVLIGSAVALLATWVPASTFAQAQAALTAADTSAIKDLAAAYARALGACQAEAFADLFAPDTGYFASGFRGQIFGRERLIALVQSERHCNAAAGAAAPARPGGGNVPAVVVENTADGVRGVADLGAVGQYQDEYVKTPQGWRFASRTVVVAAEKEAGLDARAMLAIRRLSGAELVDHYVVNDNGIMRLRSSGVAISVAAGKVTGRAYLADGSYYDDVYEKNAAGEWRIQSRTHVPAPSAEVARKGAVLGTGTFTSFVEDMDRSLAFYHDVLGMEVPPLPSSGARPYNPTNVQLFAMFDIAGAKERHQAASVPGTNVRVEIMEIQDVPHRTVPLRIQDPGAATLVLVVRDVDALLERVKRANADVVTPGGRVVRFADGSRSVLIRDVDGRFIELREPAALPAAAATTESGIVELRLSIAVDRLASTTQVYRDVLGFDVEASPADDAPLRALTGLATVTAQRARAQMSGSPLWIELVEYQGVDRSALQMRIQDRGAARLQLRAEHVDELVATLKAAGLRVVSENGSAVPIPPNFKGALVADANGFFFTPFAPCDGCAPTLRSAAQ